MTSGRFRTQWYRTSDGMTASGPLVEGGDYRTLTSPWKGADVVLHCVRDQTRQFKSTRIIALKGGRAEYPQSTMYGYERNLRNQVCIDLDIRKTADGDIVVTHDRTTAKTCDKDWVVAKKTLAELKTLDAAFHFDPQHDGSYPLRGQDITIPSLDEALALFASRKQPEAIAWIDTKDDEHDSIEENDQLYDRLIELILKHNLGDEVFVEVSSTAEADALRQRDPRIRIAFWGREVETIREALQYPHYERIAVPPQIARAVSKPVKDSGKKLHVAIKGLTDPIRQTLEQVPIDVIATENVTELFEFLGIPD